MKKIIFILLTISVVACQKNGNTNLQSGPSFTRSSALIDVDYGKIHNDFMDKAYANPELFNVEKPDSEAVYNFLNTEMEQNNELNHAQKQTCISSLNDFKTLEFSKLDGNSCVIVLPRLNTFISSTNIQNICDDTKDDYKEFLLNLRNRSLIGDIEYTVTYELIDVFRNLESSNSSKRINATYIDSLLNKYKNLIEEHPQETKFIKPIVYIGLSSSVWWKKYCRDFYINHPNLNEPIDDVLELRAVPVAADAAGALVGAFSGIISNLISGDDILDGVGGRALSGAIVGSTGIIGKIGKWFSNLF